MCWRKQNRWYWGQHLSFGFKIKLNVCGILSSSWKCFFIIKIKNCRGDVTDRSVKQKHWSAPVGLNGSEGRWVLVAQIGFVKEQWIKIGQYIGYVTPKLIYLIHQRRLHMIKVSHIDCILIRKHDRCRGASVACVLLFETIRAANCVRVAGSLGLIFSQKL